MFLSACSPAIGQDEAWNMTVNFFQNYAGEPELNIAAEIDTDESSFVFQTFNQEEDSDEFKVTGKLSCEGQEGDFTVDWNLDENNAWTLKDVSLYGCEYSAKRASDISRTTFLQTIAIALEFSFVDEGSYPDFPDGQCFESAANSIEPFSSIMNTYGSKDDFRDTGYLDYSSVLCQAYPYYISYEDGMGYALIAEVLDPNNFTEALRSDAFCDLDTSSLNQVDSLEELEDSLTPLSQCPEGKNVFYISIRKGY